MTGLSLSISMDRRLSVTTVPSGRTVLTKGSLRRAAYVVALDRIAAAIEARGLFP